MAAAWTYSDWITYDPGNATRISRLRLHIQEVSDKISEGDFSSEQKSNSYGYLQSYLDKLMGQEKEEAATAAASAGTRSGFTRGRAI